MTNANRYYKLDLLIYDLNPSSILRFQFQIY